MITAHARERCFLSQLIIFFGYIKYQLLGMQVVRKGKEGLIS